MTSTNRIIIEEEEEEQTRDVFDELPEAILLEIFNKIHDARSLCFCLSTCKRFASLIPLTTVLHLALPSSSSSPPPPHHHLSTKPLTTPSLFKTFINRLILTPFRFLLLLLNNNNNKSPSHCSHCDAADDFHSPSLILKNFNDIRSLRIQLPRNVADISNSSDPLLKWKAEFGSQLQSCVILAAANSSSSSGIPPPDNFDDYQVNNNNNNNNSESSSSSSPSYLSNGELKLRVVWTISCLIAASARHHMLKQIVLDHGLLEDAVISDGSNQGMISMDKAQVEDLRRRSSNNNNNKADHHSLTSPSNMEEEEEQVLERSRVVPALRMHMWYVPVLELPESGCVLNGATLVVIRPDGAATTTTTTKTSSSGDDELLAMGAFDSDDICAREAVRKMVKKKKAYSLEMSPF